jgi:hypothetical protein
MRINEPSIDSAAASHARRGLWIGLLIGASVLFSWILACATPFAALVAVAATHMRRRDAAVLAGTAWLVNQSIGFGVLHYPHTPEAYGWGLAIGVAAMLALPAAWAAGARVPRSGGAALAVAFVAAFVTYELVLLAASFALPGGDAAFSWAVIGRILATNLLALVGLLALGRIALAVGLIQRPRAVAASAA